MLPLIMDERQYKTDGRLFSIGHSNHTLERFIDLLRQHGIEILVDARSHPYSRFAPHYNRASLERAVIAPGIKYLYLGKELGGRPKGEEFYDTDGCVLYGRLAESPSFLDGIKRLENVIADYRAALMCAEENPSGCHRRLLVGRVLAIRGVRLEHIRGDGRIQTEAENHAEEERRRLNGQIAFFDDASQDKAWRSIQSVSQRGRRQTSSKR